MKLFKQIAVITLVVLVFGVFNLGVYNTVTVRLSNNFSDAAQVKMIDVKKFLPFNEDS